MIEPLRLAPGPRCALCLLVATLTGEDLSELQRHLASPLVQSSAISRALMAAGHPIRPQTVARQRRGECLGSL